MPVLLVVYDVVKKIAYWLHIQEAFAEREAFESHLYVRCRIPRENQLNMDVLMHLNEKKKRVQSVLGGDRQW
jgi:hypothetical protein